jgi:Macrocin-O-methyltransferase (TylF)
MQDAIGKVGHRPRIRPALHGAARAVLGGRGTAALGRCRQAFQLHRARQRAIDKPTDPRFLEILNDEAFRESVTAVGDLTRSDTARLANLWQLCRCSPPGNLIEVGAYRGGTALHLSNCRPADRIFACDTFAGYDPVPLDPTTDRREVEWQRRGDSGPFRDADPNAVAELFRRNRRDATILVGSFPLSDTMGQVREIAFAHIDVVVYQSCRDALDHLADRAVSGALFVVNDYRRQTGGPTRAVREFLAAHGGWVALPLYPGQAVLFDRRTVDGERMRPAT